MKKPKRRHGKSRLESLLERSIAQELRLKALRRDLCALSARIAKVEPPTVSDTLRMIGGSTEVWPWKPPGIYGGGSGLDRNKP